MSYIKVHSYLAPHMLLTMHMKKSTVTCRGKKASHTVLALNLLVLLLQGLGSPDGVSNPPLGSQLF